MKYYTVSFYDVKYTDYYDGQKMYIDEIIVKKGFRHATELLTGKKIEILPKGSYDKFGVLNKNYRDENQYQKTGYHLVVLEEDFIPANLTKIEEIDEYVEQFDDSAYSDIYSKIKDKTQVKENSKNQSLKQKVRTVCGIKK